MWHCSAELKNASWISWVPKLLPEANRSNNQKLRKKDWKYRINTHRQTDIMIIQQAKPVLAYFAFRWLIMILSVIYQCSRAQASNQAANSSLSVV